VRVSSFRVTAARHWRAMVIATCAAAAVVAAALIWSRPAAPASRSAGALAVGYAQVNRPAPAFALPRLDGPGTVRLSALRGRPVVINFWSSSCEPCKKESPAIAQVARAVGNKVAFLGIDTADLRNAATAFVKKSHVRYDVAYDPQGTAASLYHVPALPETFFLARSGRQIVGLQLGALTRGHLTAILRRLYGV
jgi:cytochrome c biogenesis protein CcmG, thiol:disulfide interchange protein DsbE